MVCNGFDSVTKIGINSEWSCLSKTSTNKASKDLAGIFEEHFAKLPPLERANREQAFDKAVAKIGFHAKSSRSSGPRATRRAARRIAGPLHLLAEAAPSHRSSGLEFRRSFLTPSPLAFTARLTAQMQPMLVDDAPFNRASSLEPKVISATFQFLLKFLAVP